MLEKSILFVAPDYHCSFFYRDALRKRGWKADIYVPKGYPEKLLYSKEDIVRLKDIPKIFKPFYHFFVLMRWFVKYKYFFFYGGISLLALLPKEISAILPSFRLDLFLAKIFNKKLIYLPSGCIDVDLKENISKYDDGNICCNCGWGKNACDDLRNKVKLDAIRKYFDLCIGFSDMISTQYKQYTMKYKAINLDVWKKNIDISKEFLLPKTKNIRIMHSFFSAKRQQGGKNIKGSPFVVSAIDRLRKEGYDVEYFYATDVETKNMRYYQAQADIIVEQLIYGWWGSTGVETMALGKPVICYLRKDAKENFFKYFPEYDSLPIIEANTKNIYEVLKKTVEDKEFRDKKAEQSREFAESFFDVDKNVIGLENLLLENTRESK